jgi:hypothetical protein
MPFRSEHELDEEYNLLSEDLNKKKKKESFI